MGSNPTFGTTGRARGQVAKGVATWLWVGAIGRAGMRSGAGLQGKEEVSYASRARIVTAARYQTETVGVPLSGSSSMVQWLAYIQRVGSSTPSIATARRDTSSER
ncbi:MAG: hypothetical protein JWO59_207 [Chloroflexi bacterium]|nr:hypothetical protein [Chloroflexota bacterium]